MRQVVELIAGALGHELEIVSMPYELAVPARPLLAQPLPTHRVLDLTRVAAPTSATATSCPHARPWRHTARWLAENPVPAGRHRRRWCSPTRSTTRPRTGSSTRGRPRSTRMPDVRFAEEPKLRPGVQRPRRPPPLPEGVRPVSERGAASAGPLRRGSGSLDLSIALHGSVRGRAAGRPGRGRDQGRAAGDRRHRALGRRLRSTGSARSYQICNRGKRCIAVERRGRGGPRPRAPARRDQLTSSCRTSGPGVVGEARHRLRGRAARRPRLRVALGLRRRRPLRRQGCVRHRDPGVRRHGHQPGRPGDGRAALRPAGAGRQGHGASPRPRRSPPRCSRGRAGTAAST